MTETVENIGKFSVLEEIHKPENRIKILNTPPFQVVAAHLPIDYYIDPKTNKRAKVFSTMHTDMLHSLFSVLQSLKPNTQENLYIEGRIITPEQWKGLEYNQLFSFYSMSRKDRGNEKIQDHVTRVLIPKNVIFTENEIKSYLAKPFTATSLANEIGYSVGWFPVNMLVDLKNRSTNSHNAFIPILGGVNELRIGSNTLSPNHLRMANLRIQNKFVEWTHAVGSETRSKVGDKILSAASRIISL